MSGLAEAIKIKQSYTVECFGPGTIFGFTHVRKWADKFDNLVTTEGRNKYLDATLKTGLTSPAWYVGLKGTGTVVAGDTLASHSGWSEITPYTGNRPAWTSGTISSGSVDNSASKASFSINATVDVYGAMLASVNSGTSGTLLGAGDFSAMKSVSSGDTLQVTITCSITAS